MTSQEVQARHVFHVPTTGWDRIHAWQEATGEPAFIWGTRSGVSQGRFFKSVKRDFHIWLEATASSAMTVYHDGAGVDANGALDPCPAKVLFLHNWVPRWERTVDWTIRCTGKVLVGHPDSVARIREQFGWIPERFIQSAPQPMLQSSGMPRTGSGPKARTGIWLQGQSWKGYGNRLRSIVDRWPADAGELEIVTSGSARPKWSKKAHIVWSPNLPLEFALYRLHTWDSTLLLNDYSLDSPWLMAAMALDCFPLVPEGNGLSRNTDWDSDSAPQPYPWGDVPALVDLLSGWRAEREHLLEDFSEWTRNLVSRHDPASAFAPAWQRAKWAILEQRSPNLPRKKVVRDWQPVGWFERVQRLRAGL